MSKTNAVFLVLLIGLCAQIYFSRKQAPNSPVAQPRPAARAPVAAAQLPMPPATMVAATVHDFQPRVDIPLPNQKVKKLTLPYFMSDGIVVVQGDVAIGKPVGEVPDVGVAAVPSMQRWTRRTIAYYIQPDVAHPERVQMALAMFEGTAVHFVKYDNQEDGLIFESATGVCKSYVGKIGGLQPVWIPPECGAPEIAHEILHALGFIHEQNRTDRDDFITVLTDNIEEKYRDNFEKLPPEFMAITGLAPFDFESLMIYPVWMFANGGQSTMESKVRDRPIQPGNTLSTADIKRINAAFDQLPN